MKYSNIIIALFFSALLYSCVQEPNRSNSEYESSSIKNSTNSNQENTKQESSIPLEQINKAKEIISSVSESDVTAVDAKQKFKTLCTTCHGKTGNLNANGAKDLTKSKISLEESVAQVYHGKGLMAPFKGLMTDAEIVAVSKYIENELRK